MKGRLPPAYVYVSATPLYAAPPALTEYALSMLNETALSVPLHSGTKHKYKDERE